MLYDLGTQSEHISVFGIILETHFFIQKETPNPWILIGFFHYSQRHSNLASRRSKENFFSSQSGEIYTCARRGFAFPPFIGIVNMLNAAVLLPFASLPDYQIPERFIQLD
jgi:lysozyme family protein